MCVVYGVCGGVCLGYVNVGCMSVCYVMCIYGMWCMGYVWCVVCMSVCYMMCICGIWYVYVSVYGVYVCGIWHGVWYIWCVWYTWCVW